MIKTYSYRLWVTENQRRELSRTLETHRVLYNTALDGKLLCWETAGVNWSYFEQSRWLTKQRRSNKHYASVNSSSLGCTLRKLDRAFDGYFSRCKTKGNWGHPRFKSKDRFNSFTLRIGNGRGDGWSLVGRKLRLQFVGVIRVRWHRDLPDGTIRQLQIVRENDKWYANFSIAVPCDATCKCGPKVGIDLGLTSFVTTSDGEQLGDSRSLERSLPLLRRRLRSLSRCARNSGRRKVVKSQAAALHTKIRNVRKDLHHKVAKSLVDRYGVIAAESLNIQGMLKNRRLARRISDAGWYSFTQILIGKAESAGCKVVLVDPRNTSQACSECGEIVRKSLAVRVHKCECGCVLDRDVNAAINILGRAVPGDAKTHSAVLSQKSHAGSGHQEEA